MPSYEFICETCRLTFERFLPWDADRGRARCPAGHRRSRRIYAATPVFFKGSGFYATDHAARQEKESAGPS